MQAAMRVYRSIKQIYDWGKEAGRAGHLSKPYGDVATLTSTPDQYLFALTGLYWFYKLPDCPVQDEIEQIFIDCAEFCMNRDYQVCYLSSWNMISEVGAYNAIYMLIPFLAYLVTNQERYLEEMNRVAQLGHWRTESYLGPWAREGLERMLMFERVCLAHFALSPAEIFAREYPRIFGVTPDEQQRTLAHLSEEWWKFGALGIDEDDYSNYWVDIDVRNATWRSTGLTPLQPKAEGSENEFNGDYFFIRYYSDVKFPPPLYRQIHNSLILYNHATDSQRQTEAKAMFLRLLHKTDGNRLRWMIDLDGQQLLPEIKYHCCILDSEAPFHYLYMYWRGVEQGLI